MIVAEYLPNFYMRRSEFYHYDIDKLEKLHKVEGHPLTFSGWLFRCKENLFSNEKIIVIFLLNNSLFIDFGEGSYDLLDKATSFKRYISNSKFSLCLYYDSKKIYSLSVKLYWWQKLIHDGSFSDDICPLNVILQKIEKNPYEIVNFLKRKQ